MLIDEGLAYHPMYDFPLAPPIFNVIIYGI